ncbi:MAG: guanylate kinase [Aquificaceae bacterium]
MGFLFVLSAPSGTGKTTVAEKLLKRSPGIKRIVTATTRQRREKEVDGVDYLFLSKEEFEIRIKEDKFLEYACVYGNYYGTPKEQVLKNIEEGVDSLLVIDVQGAGNIKKKIQESVLIFLLPPSIEELKRRLSTRGHVDNLAERVSKVEAEIACARYFDYIVINDFLDKAVGAIEYIINSQKYSKNKVLKDVMKTIKDSNIRNALLMGECTTF